MMSTLLAFFVLAGLPVPFVGSPTVRLLGALFAEFHGVPILWMVLALVAGIAFPVWYWRRYRVTVWMDENGKDSGVH
jgi:formate hydrogenlyase subunit 3/multisubunit Na+/H+ antiporter MnhD subunit